MTPRFLDFTGLWNKILPQAADPRPLAFYRMGVCLVSLIHLLFTFPYLEQLYGNFGLIQWTILETEGEPLVLSIAQLGYTLYQWGIHPNTTLYLVFGLHTTFLIGLLFGVFKRVTSIGAWFSHLLIVNTGNLSLYGVDSLLHTGLFYCMVMPVCDAWSIDQYRSRKPVQESFATSLAMRVLQGHLCIIYLNTGIAKLVGKDWWSGESIWRALMMPKFAVLDFSWMANYPLVPMLLGIFVVIVEVMYAVMIWPKFSRKIWLTAIVLLHLGIAIFMGLSLFSMIMIWMNLACFGFTAYPMMKWLALLRPSARKKKALEEDVALV